MDAHFDTDTYRFRDFELDVGAHQLRLRGKPVRLERRPFDLLVLLVGLQGKLVTRDEIIERMWPGKVVIDFDTGLNTLVRKVRQALGDSTDHPAFIETVPGLGYRFIAPIDPNAGSNAATATRHRKRLAAIALVLVIAAVFAVLSWRAGTVGSGQISIAILPFENLTNNDELNYLAAGIAEDTSASLAQVGLKNVRILGRVSSEAVLSSAMPMSRIGAELGADFVVASSLRAEQSKIRVTSRLLRVADNSQVWTATFDRELTGILGLQRELSIAIAEQIRLRLSPEITAAIARRQTLDPEAYDLYLQGRYQWSLLSAASSRRAVDLFERAIDRDPDYALAWAGIAQVLSTAPITGDADPTFVFARARNAVQRAVALGPDLSEVQYALGHYHLILNWDWPAAEAALRKAIAIDPNNALAFLFLGHVLSQTGNQLEARAMTRRARELDPLFSHTFALSSQVAFQARDYPLALELSRQAIAINPEAWVGYVQRGQVLAELGEYNDAITAFDSAALLSNDNTKAIAFRAYTLARAGRADEALEVINDLRQKARERFVSPYAIAIIYAGLEDRDAEFEWLERALSVRDVHMFFLPVDPRWDADRDDPRFQSLIRRSRFCGNSGVLTDGRCQAAGISDVNDTSVVAASDDNAEEPMISSANIDGIWTLNTSVTAGRGTVSGLVMFDGPADRMRQMGMCLVQQYASGEGGIACDTVDDCDSTPAELPEGGSRYCLPSQYGNEKTCYFRPGPREAYCAGSPALGLVPIPPGSYRIDTVAAAQSRWRALACFNICVAIPPAISDAATVQ